MNRYVIINADDFGASSGINRGIIEAHTRGVLTSTSLMVTGQATREAVAISRDHPKLGIGLHWDVWGEDERTFDLSNSSAVRDELKRQLDQFHALLGRVPTHVDSHRHAHREAHVMEIFREMLEPIGLPIRHNGRVNFVGGFYAQWEWLVTELKYVSIEFLQQLLRDETGPGWTEIACHPGYVSPDFHSVYLKEREQELRTLTDPRIRQTIEDLGIELRSFADLGALRLGEQHG